MTREELLQNAKPILFNTEMVRAILEGRKTVTRRICKDGNAYTVPDMGFFDSEKRTYAIHNYCDKSCTYEFKISTAERKCPICPEDVLYVRETWNICNMDIEQPCITFIYKASEPESEYANTVKVAQEVYEKYADKMCEKNPEWRPSIHMPKDAVRIFLKVKSVRVERLQECGKGWCLDIENEGVVTPQDPILYVSDDAYHDSLREEFRKLWNSTINKADIDAYGWDANPYVWVIEFERIQPEKEV